MFKRTKLCAALAAAVGGGLFAAGPTYAQQQQPPDQQLQRVEITGSSIKRIEGESALPVQVITRDEIQKTGAVNVEQLLQTVSAVSSSQGLTAASVSGATTGGISAVSLRGLSSLRTLVLLNGRRIAPYGIGFTGDSVSVDVNSIPLAAIERVEVLKDGASAVYGSDAIAGVINFILRKDYKGAEITGTYGDTTDGGASTTRIAGTLGMGDLTADRFNVMFVVSAQEEKPLFGGQRSFAKSGINDVNDVTSGNTFPANISIPGVGTRNPSNPACPPPYAIFDPQLSSKGCRFDPSPLVQLLPKAERISLLGSAKFALTSDIEAYLEASYNSNTQNNIIQPVPISDQFSLPPNNPLFNVAPYNGFSTIVLKPSSPFYPAAYIASQVPAGGNPTPDVLVRYRSAVTGNRNLTDISEAPRIAFGVKGTYANWDFDGGFLHSESRVREQVNDGFPSLSAILPLLNSGNVNFFGPNTPDIDAQLKATNFHGDAFKIKSTIDSVGAKASRELMSMAGGPMAVALGVEQRKEKYNFDANPTIQTGDISGYGGNFLNVDRSRDVSAVFGEVNVPVLKSLELDGAVRFDHYGGVGNSTTPKVSFRFQPTKQVLFRGSIGRGFRAPSLQDLYLPNTTGVSTPGLSDPVRCPFTGDAVKDCSTQFNVVFGGNANLKPEKSVNATLGLVLEPTDNISAAFDLFKINLKNVINNGINPPVILGDLAKYGSLVTRGAPDGAVDANNNPLPGPIIQIDQTNINIGRETLTGVDFDTRFRFNAGDFGRVTVSYTGTYFIDYKSENPDGSWSPVIGQANTVTGGVVPRLKTTLSANLARGAWNFTANYNWQSSYTDLPGTLEDPTDPAFVARTVGAYETWDLQGQYSGVKNWTMTLGVRNLFNRAPPYTNSGGQTSFQAGYDPQYGDPRGRFVYGTLTYSFK